MGVRVLCSHQKGNKMDNVILEKYRIIQLVSHGHSKYKIQIRKTFGWFDLELGPYDFYITRKAAHSYLLKLLKESDTFDLNSISYYTSEGIQIVDTYPIDSKRTGK